LQARILNHFIANSKFIDKAILKASLVLYSDFKTFCEAFVVDFTLN
jgi:hypothetical protein